MYEQNTEYWLKHKLFRHDNFFSTFRVGIKRRASSHVHDRLLNCHLNKKGKHQVQKKKEEQKETKNLITVTVQIPFYRHRPTSGCDSGPEAEVRDEEKSAREPLSLPPLSLPTSSLPHLHQGPVCSDCLREQSQQKKLSQKVDFENCDHFVLVWKSSIYVRREPGKFFPCLPGI